jgi:hypothetical protein
MVKSTGHDRCPSQDSRAHKAPGSQPCGGDLENKKNRFWFQEGREKFFEIRK